MYKITPSSVHKENVRFKERSVEFIKIPQSLTKISNYRIMYKSFSFKTSVTTSRYQFGPKFSLCNVASPPKPPDMGGWMRSHGARFIYRHLEDGSHPMEELQSHNNDQCCCKHPRRRDDILWFLQTIFLRRTKTCLYPSVRHADSCDGAPQCLRL